MRSSQRHQCKGLFDVYSNKDTQLQLFTTLELSFLFLCMSWVLPPTPALLFPGTDCANILGNSSSCFDLCGLEIFLPIITHCHSSAQARSLPSFLCSLQIINLGLSSLDYQCHRTQILTFFFFKLGVLVTMEVQIPLLPCDTEVTMCLNTVAMSWLLNAYTKSVMETCS